jgi:hypothetical protein
MNTIPVRINEKQTNDTRIRADVRIESRINISPFRFDYRLRLLVEVHLVSLRHVNDFGCTQPVVNDILTLYRTARFARKTIDSQ